MSKSIKHNPFWSEICYKSNKKDKTIANRTMRSRNRQIIRQNMSCTKNVEVIYPEDYPEDYDIDVYEYWPIENLDNSNFSKLREVSDTYSFNSDGLATWHDLKAPARNPDYYDYYEEFKKKMMRK